MKGIKSILLNDATLLMISTVLVNAGNYAINLVLGRVLGPEVFAEVSVIATGVLMLSFIAVGIQLTTAKYSATFFAEDNTDKMNAFIAWISQRCWMISFVLSIGLLLFSFQLQSFFHFRSVYPFLIIIVGLPIYFDFSLSRGLYQGTDQFRKLAITYILEMVGRLIVTIGLIYIVLQTNANWATEAIALGFLFSFIVTYLYARRKKHTVPEGIAFTDLQAIKHFIFVIGCYELSQIMINNSDIMLVKHYFDNTESGIYAALALIGRVVFFATWTIVTLLFPKVIQLEKRGEKHSHLFWGALSIVAAIGVTIIIMCSIWGNLILQILFGEAYIMGYPLLWKYACATTLFACANVFAYYYMSLNKYLPVAFSIVAGLSQIMIITLFHTTLEQVIIVQIWIMAVLFLIMISYHMSGHLQNTSKVIMTSYIK